MGVRAQIQDSELLLGLIDAIHLFELSGRSLILDARHELATTEVWLDERRRYRSQQVAQCQAELAACLAIVTVGGGGADCTSEASALRSAKAELSNVEHWIGRVDEVGASYRANEPRFADVLDRRCSGARAYLGAKNDIVARYEGAARGGSHAAATQRNVAASQAATAGASGSAAHSNTNGSFTNVATNLIETPQFAPGEWQQEDVAGMQRSFKQLPDIQRAIQAGSIDQLLATNANANRAYGWFYGSQPIRLDLYQGRYLITNGKHRVFLARSLGVTNLPAIVTRAP